MVRITRAGSGRAFTTLAKSPRPVSILLIPYFLSYTKCRAKRLPTYQTTFLSWAFLSTYNYIGSLCSPHLHIYI
jgi:hypothetical protein